MKILILTQYFWPENFKINELALELKKKHDVEILTSIPNYPSGKKNKFFAKSPERFYKFKNIRIHRCWQILRGQGNNFKLVFNYLSFIIFSILKGINLKKKYDLIFIFLPSPIFTAISGIVLSKFFKSKVCIWVLDIWPEVLIDLNLIKNKFIIKILNKMINYIYVNSNYVFVQSKAFKKIIKQKTKIKKIFILNSWSDEISFNKNNSLKQKNSILYFGNIGYSQNFDNLINATKLIAKKGYNFKITIIGSGRLFGNLKLKIYEEKLQKFIELKNYIKPNMLGKYINKTDFLFLSLRKGKGLNSTIPAKLQTYMNYSKPIIAVSNGEVKNIVKKANCGFVSRPDDHKSLAKSMEKAFSLTEQKKNFFGNNAKLYSDKNFNKRTIFKNFHKVLSNLN